jgi:hypothetical protein
MAARSTCPCVAWSTCLMIPPPPQVARQAHQHNRSEHQVCIIIIQHGKLANGTADSTQQPAHIQSARASQPLQRAQNLSLPSRRIALPKGVRRRAALKRPRVASIVQGVKRSQSCVADHASDGEDEDEDDENDFATETTKSFRMGDIEGLKIFLKHRIDELTMKPVRGMVTAWVKQLEPRYVSSIQEKRATNTDLL